MFQRTSVAKRPFALQSPLSTAFLRTVPLRFVSAMETLQLKLCGRALCKLISWGYTDFPNAALSNSLRDMQDLQGIKI